MNTRIFSFAALCTIALMSISCEQEIIKEESAGAMESITMYGQLEGATKTAISSLTEGTVKWLDGDNISVFSKTTGFKNNKFTSEISDNGNKAKFSGSIEDGTTSYCAIYPYYADMTYSNGTVSNAVIPATQTTTVNSFANGASLAIASGTRTPGQKDCSALNFSNLCAMIAFTIPANITFANKVVITSKSGTAMAGTCSIDCSNNTISITSKQSTSITLNGSFTGGKTYFAAVAPGTYTDGFTFAISTNGGNTYTRETTRTVTAAKSGVYMLGALSLALKDDYFTPSVTITHNYDGNNSLTGSTAKVSLANTIPSEYSSIIASCSTTVTLKQGSTVYRTLTAKDGKSFSATDMTREGNKVYIPKGTYTYEAVITYTVNTDNGTTTRTITKTGNVTSPEPTLSVSVRGYTSYSAYTGTDGQTKSTANANSMDANTIYGIGETHSSVSDAVASQMGQPTTTLTLDGNATGGGNQTVSDWKDYTIAASITFDGVTKNASKTVYITGLPIKHYPPTSDNWERYSSGNTTFESTHVNIRCQTFYRPNIKLRKKIYLPEDKDIPFQSRVYAGLHTSYYEGRWTGITYYPDYSIYFYAVKSSTKVSAIWDSDKNLIHQFKPTVETTEIVGPDWHEDKNTFTSNYNSLAFTGDVGDSNKRCYINVHKIEILYN